MNWMGARFHGVWALASLLVLHVRAQEVDPLRMTSARELLALDSGVNHVTVSTPSVDLLTSEPRQAPDMVTRAELEVEEAKQVASAWLMFFVVLLGIATSVGLLLMRRKNRTIHEQVEQIGRINAELREKNADLLSSITYAQNIQRTIVPTEAELRETLPESFIYFKPRDIVSGDLPFVHKDGDRIFIAAIDCTGHGVPAAMLSFMAYYNLNDIISEHNGMNVGEILAELHRRIQATVQSHPSKGIMSDGMDIALVELDLARRVLWYSGAQNSMLLVRDGECKRIQGTKCSIGDPSGACSLGFPMHRMEIRATDRVYLYSDGVVHQFGGPSGRKKFGNAQLMRTVAAMGDRPADELAHGIATAHSDWQQEQAQTDDIVLIGFSIAQAAASCAA